MSTSEETADPFMCKRCGLETPWKHVIVRHLRRRDPCAPTLADIDRDELLLEINPEANLHRETFACEFCQKAFSYRQSYDRHITVCKKRPAAPPVVPPPATSSSPTHAPASPTPSFAPVHFVGQPTPSQSPTLPTRSDIAVSIAALQAALHGHDILSPRAVSPLQTSTTPAATAGGGSTDELLVTVKQQLETLSREYSRLRSHTDFLAMAVMMLIREKDNAAH